MTSSEKLPNVVYALTAATANEAIAFSLLLPFVAKLVSHVDGEPLTDSGYLSGLLTSCFHFGQALTGRAWGRAGDRWGRKPVIICGLIASIVTQFFFGIGETISMLMLARFVQGLASGNMATLKTVIAESSTKSTEAQCFALLTLSWGCGTLTGSTIGGMLYNPVKQHGWFRDATSPHGIWLRDTLLRFPALLPCVCASLYAFLSLIFLLFFLEETNKRIVAQRRREQEQQQREQLQKVAIDVGSVVDVAVTAAPSTAVVDDEDGDDDVELQPIAEQQEKCTDAAAVAAADDEEEEKSLGWGGVLAIPGLRRVVVMYLALASVDIAIVETLPLLCVLPVSIGGFSMSVSEVGEMQIPVALVQISSNFVYPPLHRYVGEACYDYSAYMMAVANPLVAMLPLVVGANLQLLFLMLILVFVIRQFGISFSYTTVSIGLKTESPPEFLGEAMGITQTTSSIVRLLTPIVCTPLFAFCVSHMPQPTNSLPIFILCGVSSLLVGMYASRTRVVGVDEAESNCCVADGDEDGEAPASAPFSVEKVRENILMPWEEEEESAAAAAAAATDDGSGDEALRSD